MSSIATQRAEGDMEEYEGNDPDLTGTAEYRPRQTETVERTRRRRLPLWYVILHDDQLHTYEYVIRMLIDLFQMNAADAFRHATEVDARGVTIVARLPKDKAEQKRDEIHGYGGDPWMRTSVSMKASIEPCDD